MEDKKKVFVRSDWGDNYYTTNPDVLIDSYYAPMFLNLVSRSWDLYKSHLIDELS